MTYGSPWTRSAVDDAIVPVIAAGDVAKVERFGGRDGEQVPDARVVVHDEGAPLPPARDLEFPRGADVGVPQGSRGKSIRIRPSVSTRNSATYAGSSTLRWTRTPWPRV